MSEFDKEVPAKDLSDDFYNKYAHVRPTLIPPGFAAATAMTVAGLSVMRCYLKNQTYVFSRTAPLVAVGSVLGYGVGVWAEKLVYRSQKQKILIIKDYIDRHPEQFVEQEPRKMRDVLRPWTPVR